MCLLVGVKIGLLVKALMAPWVRARERLFPSVDSQVSLKIEIQRKLLATLEALVRLLTLITAQSVFKPLKITYCMHKHVALELSVVQETLSATFVVALELAERLRVS